MLDALPSRKDIGGRVMELIDILALREGFLLVPSMAVMGRTPVWVHGDRYSFLEVDERKADVGETASLLLRKFGKLHYLDILGYRKGRVDWNLLRDTSDIGGEVWADVGVEYSDTLIDALMSGATMCVISTKMIGDLNEIAASFELTENVILQIDHDKGVLAKDRNIRKMSPSELLAEMSSLGIRDFIFDDIASEEGDKDPTLLKGMLKALPEDGRLFVGASSLDEVASIEASGAHGAIISCSKLLKGVE